MLCIVQWRELGFVGGGTAPSSTVALFFVTWISQRWTRSLMMQDTFSWVICWITQGIAQGSSTYIIAFWNTTVPHCADICLQRFCWTEARLHWTNSISIAQYFLDCTEKLNNKKNNSQKNSVKIEGVITEGITNSKWSSTLQSSG